jgi:streptogramin lyase
LAAVCALALTVPLASFGAPPAGESMIEQVFRLRTEAADAAKGGDLTSAEAKLESARALFPTSPGLLIRLARAQAANGHAEAAVATLKAYAALGLTLDPAEPALKAVVARLDFTPVAARLKANAAPIGRLEPAASIARRDFIGEGVMVLPDGDILLSGVAARTVVRIHDGKASPFLPDSPETGALFGMARAPDGAVWIAEAWGADLPNGSGEHRTGFLKLSPRGEVLARYQAPDARQLGDLVVDGDGVVYASDSVGGGIWRLKPGESAPSLFARSNSIKSPQGLALCSGNLLVADYSSGLYRIDRTTGAVEATAGPGGVALVGIDGLVLDPSRDREGMRSARTTYDFIATQNGVEPQRVLQLRFDRGCRKLTRAEVRAASLPGVDDLSLGAVGPGRYVFVGHSQWGAWPGEGKPADDAQPVRLYSFPIL